MGAGTRSPSTTAADCRRIAAGVAERSTSGRAFAPSDVVRRAGWALPPPAFAQRGRPCATVSSGRRSRCPPARTTSASRQSHGSQTTRRTPISPVTGRAERRQSSSTQRPPSEGKRSRQRGRSPAGAPRLKRSRLRGYRSAPKRAVRSRVPHGAGGCRAKLAAVAGAGCVASGVDTGWAGVGRPGSGSGLSGPLGGDLVGVELGHVVGHHQ